MKLVLLDYDGVIRFADREKQRQVLQPFGYTVDQFFAMVWSSPTVYDLIKDEITREEWWQQVCQLHPDLAQFDHQFVWDRLFAFPVFNDQLLAEVFSLGAEVGILSNADSGSKLLIEEQMKKYPFDFIYASCDFGIAKPDAKIFEKIMQLRGCEAGEIIFFDDAQRNVEGAKKLGVNAHLYEDVATCLQLIRAHLDN